MKNKSKPKLKRIHANDRGGHFAPESAWSATEKNGQQKIKLKTLKKNSIKKNLAPIKPALMDLKN